MKVSISTAVHNIPIIYCFTFYGIIIIICAVIIIVMLNFMVSSAHFGVFILNVFFDFQFQEYVLNVKLQFIKN